MSDFRYDVFISYRHKPLDSDMARKALHFLEGYRLPRVLEKKGHTGVGRVFRDTEELSVSGILSDTIEQALRSTRVLVVICSPDTPESEWVDREVATFIELGRADYIYALLIDGDEEASFPKSLKKVPDIARRTLDVRGGARGKLPATSQEQLLRPVARCAGVTEAELVREERMRRYSRATLRWAGSAALGVVVLGVCAALWFVAARYRENARAEQAATMQLVESLTYELPGRLVALPGTYRTVAQVLGENITQMEAIAAISEDEAAVRRETAINLQKLSTAYSVLGETGAAVQAARQAAGLCEALYAADGGAVALADYAAAVCNLGNLLGAAGDYAAADEQLRLAVALQGEISPQTDEIRAVLASYTHNTAANAIQTARYREAIELEGQSAALLEALIARGNAALRGSLLQVYQNLAICHNQLGEYAPAAEYLDGAHGMAQALYEETPGRASLGALSDVYADMAHSRHLLGDVAGASHYFELAIGHKTTLAQDADNREAQGALATAHINYGAMLNTFGEYGRAGEEYASALAIREELTGAGGPVAQALVARTWYNIAENELDAGEYDRALQSYGQCLAWYQPVAQGLGAYHQAEYLARAAYYELVFGGSRTDALEMVRQAAELTPDSSFVKFICAYTLMYNGLEDESLQLYEELAARGEAERQTLREDFKMLRDKGLEHPLMAQVEQNWL